MATAKQNKKFNYASLSKDIWNKRNASKPALGLRGAADEAGISSATLYRLESVSVKPDIDTLTAVCNWLGKPLQNYFQ